MVAGASLFTGAGDAMRAARQYNRTQRDQRFTGLTERWWLQSQLADDPNAPLTVIVAPPEDP